MKLSFFGLILPVLLPILAWADIGFYPVDEAPVPPAVKAAAHKVYAVWTAGGDYQEVPLAQLTNLKAQWARLQNVDEIHMRMHYKINLVEARLCEAHDSMRCLISSWAQHGSGFVLGRRTFVTNRHVFSSPILQKDGQLKPAGVDALFQAEAALWWRWLGQEELQQMAERQIERFRADPLRDVAYLVLDENENVLFDSSTGTGKFLRYGALNTIQGDAREDGALTLALGGDTLGAQIEGPRPTSAAWVQADLVQIDLGRDLEALTPARGDCESGDKAYVAGYPSPTHTRQALGAPDASGTHLALTVGNYVGLSGAQKIMQGLRGSNDLLGLFQGSTSIVFADTDGTIGMSGGPMLNARGELCGLFKAYVTAGDGRISWSQPLEEWLFYSVGAAKDLLN